MIDSNTTMEEDEGWDDDEIKRDKRMKNCYDHHFYFIFPSFERKV